MPVGATISPLNLSDTFQTWFNRTNSLIKDVNSIDITGITPSSVHEDGLTFDFSGSNVQIGFLGVTNMTQDIVFGGNVTFSNVPEGRFVNTINGSTGDVTLTVTGVATQGSSAGSVAIFSSTDNQYTGVQVYPGVLAPASHVYGTSMGSLTSGFSGGATVEYSNIVQYATGGGAVFGLGETTGNDYQAKAEFGEAHFLGFTGAQLALFDQHIATGISGDSSKTGGFFIRYGDIGGGAASNMGVLFRSGNTLGVAGTPLLALNLEQDTVSVGSTSGLANEGFFSIVSPTGDFNRDYVPFSIAGDGSTFEIRHGQATTNLDAREGDPAAQFGPTYDTDFNVNPLAAGSTHHERKESTSLQGFRASTAIVDRIVGKPGSNIGFEVRGQDASFSVMTNFGVSAGTGNDIQSNGADIQRIALNIDQKGNVVIGGKDSDDGLLGGPTGHQSYYLGLASADAPWGYTAGYSAGAETVVDTAADLNTYPEESYGNTFQGYPDGFGSLNIVSGRLHVKGSAGNTQAFLDGKKQYLFTDGVSCEWRTQEDASSSTFVSNFSDSPSDSGTIEVSDQATNGNNYAGVALPVFGRRGTFECQDGDGNYTTGRAVIRLRLGTYADTTGNNNSAEGNYYGCGMFVSTDKGASFTYVDGSGTDPTANAAAQYATGKMCGSEIASQGNQVKSGFAAAGRPAYKKGMASHSPDSRTSFFNGNLFHAVNVPANGGLVIKFDLFSIANTGFGNQISSEVHTLHDLDARLMVDFSGSDF